MDLDKANLGDLVNSCSAYCRILRELLELGDLEEMQFPAAQLSSRAQALYNLLDGLNEVWVKDGEPPSADAPKQ